MAPPMPQAGAVLIWDAVTNGVIASNGYLGTITAPNLSTQASTVIYPPSGGVDAALSINSAISTAIEEGGGTIIIGPGLYILKGQVPITIAGDNVKIVCDLGTIFQVQTGFITPLWPMVNVTGNNVEWYGGVLDGNQIAGSCLQVNGSSTRINIRRVECKNFLTAGIFGGGRSAGILQIYESYFHGGSFPGVEDYTLTGNTCSLVVRDCWFDSISYVALDSSGQVNGTAYFEASGNLFSACGGLGADEQYLQAVYGYRCGYVNWHHNNFLGCWGSLHADTCGGGAVCDNTSSGSTGGADLFVEVTPYASIERNTIIGNTAERGIVVGVGSNNQGSGGSIPQVLVGITCSSNKVIKCLGGIGWGALQQGVFRDNYVESPTNGLAYINENSIGTRFFANQSNFASGGTHLTVDAPTSPATVYVRDDITNATTEYNQTNGGQVIQD